MLKIRHFILAIAALAIVSCARSAADLGTDINNAERVMLNHPDSAMVMLDAIDQSELVEDSLRAKYYYLKAWGHMRQNRSMIADSLISFAHSYYRGKGILRDVRSGTAFAWYKFWVGDMPGAIAMLDSLAALPDVPDSLMVQTLRIRALLGASEFQGKPLIPIAKRLLSLEADTFRKMEAKYILVNAYEYGEQTDSALMLINELIAYMKERGYSEKHFQLMLERMQLLSELGRYAESEEDINYIFRNAGADNGAADYLHLQSATNALNTGDIARASREIALADSFAISLRPDKDSYYRSFSNLLHTIIDFQQSGKIKLAHISGLNNRQRERYNRMEASQWESERGALQQQSRALALKAESQHKTVIILVIVLVSLVLLVGAGLIIKRRRQRELENEERAEALQKMVDELKSAPTTKTLDDKTPAALRRALLQQLGIIKMVAETPTEQNRELLRKISSIDSDTKGELVNWNHVFDLINNLYAGFYNQLHSKYGEVLTNKEEQIVVLMMAGFSTKEISVISSQTTATIYVRKSAIRKKLGVPEKEDIVAFIKQNMVD